MVGTSARLQAVVRLDLLPFSLTVLTCLMVRDSLLPQSRLLLHELLAPQYMS
ncbi:hypothetical protein HBI56_181060 [Parastagonospora nodorum]|uniref:Uncharacterized protein n=1 Tax=Phaeosphaeria nodorum (strain SN15 / ATCC MYA-4574 / FGSC 10173) TaxID=321614 RepID=A0A7U2F948_PHANO|nr:hypothetical protein HBH56_186440 [Parastagonospora nodorum]QRD01021.1 hypothetical protein JI435_416130 [Parastagonospora nodorum SN15]KAH3925246.1 hypothetical protein HBH54_182120 [Parastagonospora nodorum]KAH3962119.1 hypothetical protein HBH52_227000 [Parastagonospora nodorum]KAH3992035.1 hypothetical protein HBI10_222680 [Parastagonospora nodorum]